MESIITLDEYTHLKEISLFECPRNRDHRDCWLDNNCRKRPNPCVECPSTRRVDRVRESYNKEKIDWAWKKHEKNCAKCNLWSEYEEERTYRETCERMKHANLILRLIQEGSIEILRNHDGWAIPI